ncbi:MAG: penicillin-binding protein 2, partial [Thermodesulfobacteriota bacterium]
MQNFKSRLIISAVILGQFFLIFFGRIFYLQILRGEEYERFSAENSIRLLKVPAPRGRILDRNGKEIVINRPSFNLVIFPREIKNVKIISQKLSEILGIPEFELRIRIEKLVKQNFYTPSEITKDISRDELALVEINRDILKGVDIEVNFVRNYPNGNSGALMLGYLGLATEQEIKENSTIDADQQTGKFGVEKYLENTLVGKKGREYIVVDALGRQVETSFFKEKLNNYESSPGNDVYLTIDIDLQNAAEQMLNGKSGAIVAMDI